MKDNHRPPTIDQRLVRALAHPLRVQILEILTERIASPNRVAEELEIEITHVAYHTRALDRFGCLRLVDTARRRGATEHFYKAVPGSFIGDPQWRHVPLSVRGGVTAAALRTFVDKCVAALTAGTIDGREDTTFCWMPLQLDERGWEEVTAIMNEAAERVRTAQAGAASRLSSDGRTGSISAVAGFANFETAASGAA